MGFSFQSKVWNLLYLHIEIEKNVRFPSIFMLL